MNDRAAFNQIPICTSLVCAYIFRRVGNEAQFLILKRKSRYMFGLWQQVAGKIENGETAAQAIVRELKEETGLAPSALYSGGFVESFYDPDFNCIQIIPVFVAEAPGDAEVFLSNEHSEYKWLLPEQAREYFTFYQQRNSIELIYREFVLRVPPSELTIGF